MAVPAVTANSPVAGSISWAGFNIQYQGNNYSVPGGNTANRWVWWEYNAGVPILNSGANLPTTLTDDDLVLFGNKDGIPIRVQSTSFIDGELLIDGSVLAKHIRADSITTEHLTFTNSFGEALQQTDITGTALTGPLLQTNKDDLKGVKIGTINEKEGIYAYDNTTGELFFKAVPGEALVANSGDLKPNSMTVTESSSLGGTTEITRAPDGSAGVLRLTGYTTAPKSPPTLSSGYDTVQFTEDGLWGNRRGWTTDGTYWYTVEDTGSRWRLQKWNADGTFNAESVLLDYGENLIPHGCVYGNGWIYVLHRLESNSYFVERYSTGLVQQQPPCQWINGNDIYPDPGIGFDHIDNQILIASARSNGVVRIYRFTMPAGGGVLVNVGELDTIDYDYDIPNVLYGSFDFTLGSSKAYVFTSHGSGMFRAIGESTGDEIPSRNWQSGMSSKVGFTYPTAGTYMDKFVSMDKTGKMRIYGQQDHLLDIGSAALVKSASNTLANATYETDQSLRSTITLPKRSKLVATASAINTGGTNAPDRVKIYVGQSRSASITTTSGSTAIGGASAAYTAADVGGTITGTGIPAGTTIASVTSGTSATLSKAATASGTITATIGPGRTGMWKQTDPALGVTTMTYPSLVLTGTNPPATNGFLAAGGTVQRLELADGSLYIDALGNGGRTSIGLRATTTAQSIPNATWTKVDLLGTLDHQFGDITVSSSIATVPTAGVYHANCGVYWTASNNVTERAVALEYWTGTDPGVSAGLKIIRLGASASGQSLNVSMSGANDMYLPAGAKVRLCAYQASGAALNVSNAFPAYFNLRRVG